MSPKYIKTLGIQIGFDFCRKMLIVSVKSKESNQFKFIGYVMLSDEDTYLYDGCIDY
jgi:hypothetical protein